jgi:hypothetical protein
MALSNEKACNRAARAARSNQPFATAQASYRQTHKSILGREILGRIFTKEAVSSHIRSDKL